MEQSTVYVNNLSYKRDEKGIRQLFSKYGRVKMVKIVVNLETNESKGMAFVEMDSPESAHKALKGLNGAKIDGRTLKVKPALPQGTRARAKTELVQKQIKKAAARKEAEQKRTTKKAPAPRKEVKKTGLDKLINFLKTKKD